MTIRSSTHADLEPASTTAEPIETTGPIILSYGDDTNITRAINALRALTDRDGTLRRLEQARKLAAVDMPDDLLDIAIKIRSRNAIYEQGDDDE